MAEEGAVLYDVLTAAGTGLFDGFGTDKGGAVCGRAQGLVLPFAVVEAVEVAAAAAP